ncbi:polycomb protein Pcl isoform X1 [Drosophila nasuta]|uniref:polycomb protein Pcl isoform X1 n=1 Tax=Drosophila nasuta TaxID=42062 RepID=UPI00295F4B7E|nr:polycomb protein Pcl isoform X1 [Drosophila nasuta]XP_060654825.1 polycomb protein Pcl isoform X1 [Drosophila nasuta]XP_060654826.1 polycomb protein Pcl isoform X1 [Drosophila nasuta]
MMNNHFHLQPHEHNTPQNVAPQFAGAVSAPTTSYSYLTQPATGAPNGQQWLTYQILPPAPATLATNAGGGLPSALSAPKRHYYANATTTTAAATHPNSIQITNNYATQQQQQTQQPTQSSPFKANNINNIRIISTAPNVYSLNKGTEQLNQLYAAPTSTTATATAAELYAPVGAYYTTSASLQPKLQPPPLVPVSNNSNSVALATLPNNAAPSSTVVLDRINICINNHYAEPNLCQPSPIIPAIQHKALIPLIDSSTADSSCSSTSSCISNGRSSSSVTNAVIVIDEPDSTTTTPHTPPTTPETLSSPLKSPESSGAGSPTTQLKQSYTRSPKIGIEESSAVVLAAAPPTPPTPPPVVISPVPAPAAVPAPINYALQEDVFIKCNDGRFYLGTIIAQSEQQYLVRFDDKSEQWCEREKLRKLGNEPSSGGGAATSTTGPMCVACKRAQHDDIVEICERCGRGYHRGCTTEIASGVWCCKRCAKPMKMQPAIVQHEASKPQGICRQLPYHVDKLSWDEKHRVNEEQIYCYCGKPGKFDYNMLQCCKCRNWFHTQCMQDFKGKLLRGDMFFIFCCTVCNDGVEFVRRLQIDWVDMLHITLYNLRKHQHQKYHHLLKDIWPFILEQRQQFPICDEWRQLPETTLMERIKHTLKEYSDRFVCGREFKRAPAYYALRHSGPPLTPSVFLQPHEELSDELLVDKFRLLLMPGEVQKTKVHTKPARDNATKNVSAKDVYEFHTDDDEEEAVEAEAEVDTSEDEIPIKQIMDMAKKQSNQQSTVTVEDPQQVCSTPECTPDLADDNANDGEPPKLMAPAPPQVNVAVNGNSNSNGNSRKRKAFRSSKRYDSSRNCDLSSDENSSSSRGTSSLDLIIPPPVNFLGRNNPFLMATPKKSTQQRNVGTAVGVAGIINSIFKLKHNAKHLSNIELVKAGTAAQQPRMVRTIKRRLSAKDITIGPNQEVRRRRTRRLTTAIEVINTTTINPIPSHYFPIYAKDLQPPPPVPLLPPEKPTHGRLLRQRPQKSRGGSPGNSRRNSTSSTATNVSSSASSGGATVNAHSMLDLKQSVNRYFGGAMNRIDAGESFAIRAKRRMGNGQVQYLVEWGGDTSATTTSTTMATNGN